MVGVSILPLVAFVTIDRAIGERRLMDLLLKSRESVDSPENKIDR